MSSCIWETHLFPTCWHLQLCQVDRWMWYYILWSQNWTSPMGQRTWWNTRFMRLMDAPLRPGPRDSPRQWNWSLLICLNYGHGKNNTFEKGFKQNCTLVAQPNSWLKNEFHWSMPTKIVTLSEPAFWSIAAALLVPGTQGALGWFLPTSFPLGHWEAKPEVWEGWTCRTIHSSIHGANKQQTCPHCRAPHLSRATETLPMHLFEALFLAQAGWQQFKGDPWAYGLPTHIKLETGGRQQCAIIV